MYVNLKKRTNKKDEIVYYIYLCESKRIEGKVKNTQDYMASIKEDQVHTGFFNEKFLNKLNQLEDSLKDLVISKVLNQK